MLDVSPGRIMEISINFSSYFNEIILLNLGMEFLNEKERKFISFFKHCIDYPVQVVLVDKFPHHMPFDLI